jgi:hypothetical protein
MNFKEKFEHGLLGLNYGLPMGMPQMDIDQGGVQRAALYGIAAGPKVGKSTFVDKCFLIHPFLYYLQQLKDGNPNNLSVEWIYFSFEISRVKKEFKFVVFFMFHDYGVQTFQHKDQHYPLSPNYIEGKMRDNDNEIIIPSEEHQKMVHKIYQERIIPLFGEYDSAGKQLKKGLIVFVEHKENPTGIRNFIGRYTKEEGTWLTEPYESIEEDPKKRGEMISVTRQKRISWTPHNPDKFVIIIMDHLRKLPTERGFNKKQIVDKMIEYQVEFRNWCGFTFVDIIHLNRGMSDVGRLKYNNEFIYPTGDDVKETGNLSEEADYLWTMMDPNDVKYGLKKHFGLAIKTTSNDEIYPGYVSLHLVESRDTECPRHYRGIMKGNINHFEELVEQTGYGMA